MAPQGGEWTGKESSWVWKDGAGGEDGHEERPRGDRREGRGRGRQGREGRGGGRRDGRDTKDALAGAMATEDHGGVHEAKGRGKGRGHKGGRRGNTAQHEVGQLEYKENASGFDVEDEHAGAALLSVLKDSAPKVIRYTKGKLLSIARLPVSNVKPPDLSPLIDKENKESQLLIRMAGARPGDDGEGVREKRDRRSDRRNSERHDGSDGEEERALQVEVEPAAVPAVASSPSSPKGRAQPPTPGPTQPGLASADKLVTHTAAPVVEEDAELAAARLLETWNDQKTKVEQSAGPAGSFTGGQNYPASLLQQQSAASQAHSLSQAHAMQAAAYMQAVAMSSAAAARSGYPNPWDYNPFPYNPYVAGAYPGSLDYIGIGTQQAQAVQAKLAAAQAAVNPNAAGGLGAGSGYGGGKGEASGYGRGGGASAKAAAKATAAAPTPAVRASQQGAGSIPATASPPASKKAPIEISALPLLIPDVEYKTTLPVQSSGDGAADSKNEDEGDEGCAQT